MTENEALEILKISPQMKKKIPNLAKVYEVAVKALEEIQQYRAIGTVEECGVAMERMTPKKVNVQKWIYTKCKCGYEFSKHHGDGYYSIPYEKQTKYCPNCGQCLDWSE